MSEYTIKVLELGYDPKFPAGIAFDFWHMADSLVYSPFSMTLIQGEGHNILFDCGFDPACDFEKQKIAQEGDENCHNPEQVLDSVGISAADIDTVILSHCHWDHIGGLRFFENAKFYIQRSELNSWTSAIQSADFPVTHKNVVNNENLLLLQNYERLGKLVLLDGDCKDLFPGISVLCANGHSFAQNMLFIDSGDQHYALIGDVSMRPESFLGNEQFNCILPNLKFAVGTIENIASSYRKVLNWVHGEVSNIIMSHDGTLHEKHQSSKSPLGLNVIEVN